MKLSVIICLVMIFFSCEVDYEDNSRLLFKGDVSENLQNPLPNIPIEVHVSNGESLLNFTQRIGVGTTISNGTFEVVALSPKNPTYLQIRINSPFQEGNKPEFGSYTLRRVDILGEYESTYNIPKISIGKRIDATLQIKRVDNLTDTLSFQYYYANPDRILDFSQKLSLDLLEDPNFYMGSGKLPSAQNTINISLFNLTSKDTLFLSYKLVNDAMSETIETELIHNPETGNYVFEF